MDGQVVGVFVSPGGIPKSPVARAEVTRDGLVGDGHNDTSNHGGPNKAVCLYSLELYQALVRDRILVKPGDFGENVTTAGIDMTRLQPGDRLAVGDACELELTKIRTPCYKLSKYDERLPKAILGRSGWKARVIREGVIRVGDFVEVRPASQKT